MNSEDKLVVEKAKTYVSGEGGINYLDTSYFDCNIEHFKPEVTELPKDIPVNTSIKESYKCIKKKLRPSEDEIKRNPRSRSAVMRVFSKL